MASKAFLDIGFHNTLLRERIVAIIDADSAPMRRLKEDARKHSLLIDATNGRKTRSQIVMDSRHVVLSSIEAETLQSRLAE